MSKRRSFPVARKLEILREAETDKMLDSCRRHASRIPFQEKIYIVSIAAHISQIYKAKWGWVPR